MTKFDAKRLEEAQRLRCPECGAPMVLRETSKYRYPRTGEPRKFWSCSRFPACRGIHGAHPNGKPLGVPANAETKRARIRAHRVFDTLWRGGPMSRDQAYRWMQDALGMTKRQAHIGKFTIDECERLITAVAQLERGAFP